MTNDPREELRRTVAQLAELTARRDDLIRELLEAGIGAPDLAAVVGVSRQRIGQIKNRTR